MDEFNHLNNLCEFLDRVDNFNRVFFDDDYPFNEDTGRQVFGGHIYNLLVEPGADVDEELARRVTDKLVAAFYKVPTEHYKESLALQKMLRAADDAIEQQCVRLHRGDYTIDTFTVTIGTTATEFMIGGPQFDALYAFAYHIAHENGYQLTMCGDTITVEE